jgi:hypothetical protein
MEIVRTHDTASGNGMGLSRAPENKSGHKEFKERAKCITER